MPYLLEASAADVLKLVDSSFRVESAPGRPGFVYLVFEAEAELDAYCARMRRAGLAYSRLGFRAGMRGAS